MHVATCMSAFMRESAPERSACCNDAPLMIVMTMMTTTMMIMTTTQKSYSTHKPFDFTAYIFDSLHS